MCVWGGGVWTNAVGECTLLCALGTWDDCGRRRLTDDISLCPSWFPPIRNRGALAAEVPLFLDVLAAHGMNHHVVEPGLALLRK